MPSDHTQGDDDRAAPAKLLDLADAAIERYRADHPQVDDDRDPHDAAEHDFVEFLRRHRDVVRHAHLDLGGHHKVDRCLSYGSHLFSSTPRDVRSLNLNG